MEDFLYLLIILGSLQGIIISTLLFARRSAYADSLLALIILIAALPGFHLYLHHKNLFATHGIMAIVHASVPWILVTGLGPLIMFYVKAVADPHFRISRKQALWFLPLIIDLFPKFIEIFHLASWLNLSDVQVENFSDQYNKYADIPRWMIMAGCIFITRQQLKNYHTQDAGIAKQVDTFKWLKQFVEIFCYFLLLWLLFLIPYVLPVSDLLLKTVGWFPIYIPLATMIYWLGIRGYLSAKATNSMEVSAPKNAIGETEMKHIIERLTNIMQEEKLFLNPELDLTSVSTASNIPSRSISFALNQHLGKTFNQYINEFRVEEFKHRSANLQNLSIAGLASVCGFPSLPTFQRVFKQMTGQTPSEYLRQITP